MAEWTYGLISSSSSDVSWSILFLLSCRKYIFVIVKAREGVSDSSPEHPFALPAVQVQLYSMVEPEHTQRVAEVGQSYAATANDHKMQWHEPIEAYSKLCVKYYMMGHPWPLRQMAQHPILFALLAHVRVANPCLVD